jgi:hypothetical protein
VRCFAPTRSLTPEVNHPGPLRLMALNNFLRVSQYLSLSIVFGGRNSHGKVLGLPFSLSGSLLSDMILTLSKLLMTAKNLNTYLKLF